MSKRQLIGRPWVVFDAQNKDHRRWFAQFQDEASWGHCPVRFICPNDVGYDLTIIIREQLIKYYVDKEFGKEDGNLA